MQGTEWLLDLLFPPKCPFCGALLAKGELLCPACQKELPWLSGAAAERKVELTAGCVSVLRYQDKVRKAVHDYKFNGKSGRSRYLGPLIAQAVADRGYTAQLVTWPSLSKKRLRKRGYDQAELLAREVGKALGLPVIRTLEKTDRPAQSGIEGEAARRANLLGAYTALEPEWFRGKSVLLVDDVLTTGKNEIQAAIKSMIVEQLDQQDLGIQLVNITIQDSEPPTVEVMEAFKAVETAKQGKETALNNANKYRNEQIPQAQAKVDGIIKDAEARKTERINEATAQVARFNAMYEEYVKNPTVTRQRMFFEAMEEVLPGLKVIIESPNGDMQTIYPIDSFTNPSQSGGNTADSATAPDHDTHVSE